MIYPVTERTLSLLLSGTLHDSAVMADVPVNPSPPRLLVPARLLAPATSSALSAQREGPLPDTALAPLDMQLAEWDFGASMENVGLQGPSYDRES